MSKDKMTAHKKIYLQVEPDEDATWCEDRINKSDIEYIPSQVLEDIKKRAKLRLVEVKNGKDVMLNTGVNSVIDLIDKYIK